MKERKERVAGAEAVVGWWGWGMWAKHPDRKQWGEEQKLEVSVTERKGVVVEMVVLGWGVTAEEPSLLTFNWTVFVDWWGEAEGEIVIRVKWKGRKRGGRVQNGLRGRNLLHLDTCTNQAPQKCNGNSWFPPLGWMFVYPWYSRQLMPHSYQEKNYRRKTKSEAGKTNRNMKMNSSLTDRFNIQGEQTSDQFKNSLSSNLCPLSA